MYPYQVPNSTTPPLGPSNFQPEEVRQRGGCLTIWLGLSLALALISAANLFQLLDYLRPGALRPGAGITSSELIGIIVGYGVLVIGIIASIYGIWHWKRWGVYGMVAVVFVSPVIELMVGDLVPRDCVQPFLQSGFLWFLIRNKWKYFE